jgi:hypothetical protein
LSLTFWTRWIGAPVFTSQPGLFPLEAAKLFAIGYRDRHRQSRTNKPLAVHDTQRDRMRANRPGAALSEHGSDDLFGLQLFPR